MDIVIPSYGRPDAQVTLEALVAAGVPVHLVVQQREVTAHHRTIAKMPVNLHVLPDIIRTIAPTRDWIMENVGEDNKVVMLDDDLTFYLRRGDDPTKFADAQSHDIRAMLTLIEHELKTFAHVGVAAREGANRNTDQFIDNTRIMRVLGYRRDVLRKECFSFSTMEVMEDFHIALKLLEHGYPNRIVNSYCQNQAGSGKSGGCNHFRTKELHAANAHKLAERHPRFVKTVSKTTKGAWGGGERTDVTIQWKKAYAAGQSLYGARVLD